MAHRVIPSEVQLIIDTDLEPAEISAFGSRFAISRNAVAFVLAVPLALSTVVLVRWLS